MFLVNLLRRTTTRSPKMSRSRCVACHIQEPGMIAIYQHPRGVDRIWTYVTGIIVKARDQLCIPCYDELRVSHRFKEKCIHNNINRLGRMAKQHGLPRTQLDPPTSDDSLATSEPDDPGLRLELSHRQAEECLQQLAPLGAEFVIKNEPVQDQHPDELSGIEESSYTLSMHHHPQQPQQHHQQSAETNHNDSHDDALDVIKMAVELSPEDIGLRAVPLSSESGDDNDDDDDDDDHDETHERQKQRSSNGRDSLPTVKCSHCDQSFTSGALLKQHIHKEHSGLTPTGRVRRDNTNAVKFRRMLSGKINALMCRYCYREFDSADTKMAHEKTHLTDPKPFQCSFTDCNRLFQHRSALNRHFYTHVTPKRFKCSVCPKRFHQQSSMVVHERLHRGDRPHICPQCGKGFTHLSNVKRHIRFHNGEKPYECAQCPARFTTSTDLRRHMNSRRCLSRSLKSK